MRAALYLIGLVVAAMLLADLGVTKTHSRPHVSDDNPFSESMTQPKIVITVVKQVRTDANITTSNS